MTSRSVVSAREPDSLRALKASLAERLAALRGVQPDQLPPAPLDISVRRVGDAYDVCPADWEQLRHARAQGFLASARASFDLVSARGPEVSPQTLTPRPG